MAKLWIGVVLVAAILAGLVWWTLHVTNDGRKAACPPGNPHCQSPR